MSAPREPSDDELEARLRALKGGPAAGPAGSAAGGPSRDAPRAVAGEVIEPAAFGWMRGGAGRTGGGRPAGGGGTGHRDVPTDRRDAPAGPAVRVLGWSVREIDAGRMGLWIGLGLVLLGVYLVLSPWVPGVQLVGSGAILLLGLAAVLAGATRRAGSWAIYVGVVVGAVGAAGVLAGLGILRGGGWATLAVGLALLGLAGRRAARRAGWRPLAILGAIVAGIGGVEILGWAIPGFPSLGELLLAGMLVGVGYLVLRSAMRPRAPRDPPRG